MFIEAATGEEVRGECESVREDVKPTDEVKVDREAPGTKEHDGGGDAVT